MALFNRFFPKRKLDGNHESRKRDRSCQITADQVRLLLFKECDWRGRKLLFDSSTIDRVPAGKNDRANRQTDEAPCIVEVSEGFAYLYKGPAADASVLGEMIFGAVAMNYKGVSLKIHIMDEPRRLMCTKVFCVPTSRRISRAERKGEASSCGDMRGSTTPLNVPTPREEGVSLSFSLDRGDSGYYDQSPYSSVNSTYDYFSMFDIWDGNNNPEEFFFHSPQGRKLSNSSNGSWQRRSLQNVATRFDLGSNLLHVPTAVSNVTSNDSQVYSNSSTSGTSDSLGSNGSNVAHRKSKLGLALLITVTDSAEMDLVRRCVEHSPQLQALVCRLRLATLAAGAGSGFVSTLHRAAADASKWLTDLMYGPRLQPVWLGMVTGERRVANKMADTLLSDLCTVLSVGDTKHTNFFISTLLTHVLTYHLGWVTTVSPYDILDPQKHPSSTASPRPYNALWAQLSDLCGSIGFPPRAARTIIAGATNAQFVNKLLTVLTYFVRSGDVIRSDFEFQNCALKETNVISVNGQTSGMKRTTTCKQIGAETSFTVPPVDTQNSDSSVTLAASAVSLKRSNTLANINQKLSSSKAGDSSTNAAPMTSQLKRNPTVMISLKASSESSLMSLVSDDSEPEQVVFVLGDDEKLVGLKNKSNNGRSVKKSSKIHHEPLHLEGEGKCDQEPPCPDSPTKCCAQTLQHSKPIKHSGFKFEFDKYPQIVTNYMKSKNLEILDRHYIGKPGNLKLDNFQFDPTIVLPIQEERCEICYKCQQMESMLQTPTNASEMEYMNDMPRLSEPQFAKESVVREAESHREMSPKVFVRQRTENTIVVNAAAGVSRVRQKAVEAEGVWQGREVERSRQGVGDAEGAREGVGEAEGARQGVVVAEGLWRVEEGVRRGEEGVRRGEEGVQRVVQFAMPLLSAPATQQTRSGFDLSLLGGVTDHYVPDLILQGTIAKPNVWETELRRDLDLSSYLNKALETPIKAVAIVGDTNTWEVRVVGRECGSSGMSSLVGATLDALPAMWRAKVPAHQCLSFLEGKLREFCVLSKTLADMLMSTDFCDIATLTKALNIDVNDVPLLLAVATTHTPQVATRYGISYR